MSSLKKGYEWAGAGQLKVDGKYISTGETFRFLGDYFDNFPGVKRREDLDAKPPAVKTPKPKPKKEKKKGWTR